DEAKQAKGSGSDLDLDAADLQALVTSFKKIFSEHTGREFPQEPREQLDLAVRAVFASWNADRAVLYRRQERIPGRGWRSPGIRALGRRACTATIWPTRRVRMWWPGSVTRCPWRSWKVWI